MNPLEQRVAEEIQASGPIAFDRFVERALYDPEHGFYVAGGAAGRKGDFITSPEVGPLFGAVIGRALDTWWDDLGRPDPFVVADVGAGPGTLRRAVLASEPACAAAVDFRNVDPYSAGGGDHLPAEPFVGVILANELLDNLSFGLAERRNGRWHEVHVTIAPHPSPSSRSGGGAFQKPEVGVARTGDEEGPSGGAHFSEVLVPFDDGDEAATIVELLEQLVPNAGEGTRVPVQRVAARWLVEHLALLQRGRLVVLDYADLTPSLAARPSSEWLRTYQGHRRGGSPLASLGSQDITCEVAVDQLSATAGPPTCHRIQADFLRAHGLDDLVEEGRRIWAERAHLGDLQALKARSRVNEAAALTDPAGLGAFRVLEWQID